MLRSKVSHQISHCLLSRVRTNYRKLDKWRQLSRVSSECDNLAREARGGFICDIYTGQARGSSQSQLLLLFFSINLKQMLFYCI